MSRAPCPILLQRQHVHISSLEHHPLMLRHALTSKTHKPHRLIPLHAQHHSTKPPPHSTPPQPPSSPQPPLDPPPSPFKQSHYQSTPPHHNLPTFLTYATREHLSPSTTVYQGTHYEYTVLSSLTSLHIHTTRTGGAHDLGIDLLGHWSLPHLPRPLRIFIQCKRSLTTRASQIRELAGSFEGLPTEWREGCLGVLVTVGAGTRGLREAMARSEWGMCHVVCSVEGEVQGMSWNRKAEEGGLEGVSVGMTYTAKGTREVRLLYRGVGIPPGRARV